MSIILFSRRLSVDQGLLPLRRPAVPEARGAGPLTRASVSALLAVALGLALVVSPAPSAAETQACLADQDAYISEHYPSGDTSAADLLAAVHDTCHPGGPCDRDSDGYVRSAPLVKFNLYSIPLGSTIQSCELCLECWDFGSAQHEPVSLSAFQVTSSWADTVTWYSKPTWTVTPRPRAAIGAVGAFVMDDPALAEIVQTWVDGTAYNHGLLLWPEGALSASAYFYSMETAPTESAKPRLTIHYEPPPEGSPFLDVGPGHWAFDEILACFNAGVVQGYPDRCYRPEESVLRDQMAVYVVRALTGGDANVPEFEGTPRFPDVPSDHWALKYVEYAAGAGVVGGYDDGCYRPEGVVTRDQMAVYIARALVAPSGDAAVPDPPDTPSFPDVPSEFWAYRWIEYCHGQGVVHGYSDGYRPEETVDRAQMAVYVQRAFDLPM